MLLQLSETIIINTEQITDVDFTPGHKPETEDRIFPARLEIILTSVELEETSADFAAFHLAAASVSRRRKFYGTEAERIWGYFQSVVSTIPERATA